MSSLSKLLGNKHTNKINRKEVRREKKTKQYNIQCFISNHQETVLYALRA
jgi:hypothetical protein